MSLQIEFAGNEMIVRRSKWAAYAMHFCGLAACFGVGIGFLFVPVMGLKIFGGIFTCVGVWVLVTSPAVLKKISGQNGLREWEVSKSGISRMHGMSAPLIHFPWSHVERIVLTQKLKEIETGERSYSRNVLLVFLKREHYDALSLIQASKLGIGKSPDGAWVMIESFPKNMQVQACNGILQYAPTQVSVVRAERTEFDWKQRVVRVDPLD